MCRGFAILILTAGLSVPALGFAQTSGSDTALPAIYEALPEPEQRRLDFYAGKIVSDIEAIITASGSADIAAFHKSGTMMKTNVERFSAAAEKSGFSASETDQFLRAHIDTGLSGPVPFFMVDDSGRAGVESLLALEVNTTPRGDSSGNYVDDIRNAGQATFGN